MEVRLARPEDAEAVADVFIPSFESLTFLPMLHSHEEHRAFIRGVIDRDEVWIAEENGHVVGMAVLTDEMLDHFYVHPEAHGRGAGSALLEQAKARRPGGFTFWVFQQNEQARRFYEQRGCRLVRLTDGSGNEEKTPAALYEWRPGEPEEDA
jgi:GNAT superfamily N-acetyltransferase